MRKLKTIEGVWQWAKENKYKPVGEKVIRDDSGGVLKIIYTFRKLRSGQQHEIVFKKRGVE